MSLATDYVGGARFVKSRPSTSPDPIVRWLFDEIARQHVSYVVLADIVGVSEQTLHAWKSGRRSPSLFLLECVLNALGYTLSAAPKTG